MSLTQSDLADLAALNAGRFPQWTALEQAPKTPPSGSSPGVSTNGTMVTAVAVQLRRDNRRPAIVVDIQGELPVSTTTYALTVDGQTYSVSVLGGSVETLQAICVQLAIAISAGGVHVAALDGAADTNRSIVIWRVNNAMPGAVSATTNVAETQREEATSAAVTVWGRSEGVAGWYQVGQTEPLNITANWTDIIRSSPLSHVYVQIVTDDTSAAARFAVGPCAVQASGT